MKTLKNPTRRAGAFMLLPVLLLFAAASGMAQERQSLESIRETAQRFVAGGLKNTGARRAVTASELDSRLRLAPCGSRLEAFLPRGGRLGSNTTVGVRCRGPKSWKVFVPVRVVVHDSVLVTTKPLRRGAVVSAGDVVVSERDVGGLPFGYYTDPATLAGMTLARSVPQGTVLTPTMLEAQNLIKRGQRVTLVANTTGIAVSMAGKALMDGADGMRIRVLNLSSGREIEGVVRSAETVEILMN